MTTLPELNGVVVGSSYQETVLIGRQRAGGSTLPGTDGRPLGRRQ